MKYVAAVDAWGYVCVWDHTMVVDGMVRQGKNERNTLIARWKVSEEPVVDVQFMERNGKTCVLLLLPPSPPSVTNVPSLYTLDCSRGDGDGSVGQLLATWRPHATAGKDCLCFVDALACPAVATSNDKSPVADGSSEEEVEGEGNNSAAARLALYINNILSVLLSLRLCM